MLYMSKSYCSFNQLWILLLLLLLSAQMLLFFLAYANAANAN